MAPPRRNRERERPTERQARPLANFTRGTRRRRPVSHPPTGLPGADLTRLVRRHTVTGTVIFASIVGLGRVSNRFDTRPASRRYRHL